MTLAELPWHPLLLSLKVASVATVLALGLGLALALLLTRKRFPGAALLEAIFMLPLVLPPTVIGFALLHVLGRNGWVGGPLLRWFDISLIFTWPGAVIAATVVALPLVLKASITALEGVDGQLVAAARTLGQPEADILIRIVLPLAWPGILAGTLLAFARAMGEFGASLMVAGSIPGHTQTASMAIYDAVQAGDDMTAGLLVLATSAITITILLTANRLKPRA
ncbi:molybdate ABC transporter permease subunit [Roseateles paludis]|jgi:molybdate transport system permease protein|uniref:Molybdenum transport system permease n=1 Tax=Roseateles paludis TaxID=3145238 RepID=A0ABV0FVE2_9BURK